MTVQFFSCVIDPLYKPHWDSGHVYLKVFYGMHSEEAQHSLPQKYVFVFDDTAHIALDQYFIDSRGQEGFDCVSSSIDTLTFEGYLPPSLFHLYSYAPADSITISEEYAEVTCDKEGMLVRRPGHLFAGAWTQQIEMGKEYSDTLLVRQHTREIVFRIFLSLGDSIELESSDVRLSNVPQRLSMADGSLLPEYNTNMRLNLQIKPQSTSRAHNEDIVIIEDTICILSPEPIEYASGLFASTLSVRLNFRHNRNGISYAVQPVDCSFKNILDDAYSNIYINKENDPYCIKRYVWECSDTVRFFMESVDTVPGDIKPWDIVTNFGKL